MYNKRSLTFLALASTAFLTLNACGKTSSTPAQTGASTVKVSGAVSAVTHTLEVATQTAMAVRPAALLSIYVTTSLADGSVIPVSAAKAGVEAQMALHAQPTDSQIDSLYQLLDEFGAVLSVDIPDMLNRSSDRAHALDAYVQGLTNVTERARRRQSGIEDDITALKQKVKDQKAVVKDMDKQVKDAAKLNDFTTVGAKRQELATEQATLTDLQSQLEESTDLQEQFASLVDLAGQRLTAVNANREALIAGIHVTDMPGIDELGVIQSRSKRGSTTRKSGGLQPFGGL